MFLKIRFFFAAIAIILLSNVYSQNSDYNLYIFLLHDCKISQSYSLKINDLHEKYGSQVNFVGVFPNRASNFEDIESYKVKYNHQFSMETDYEKEKALFYGVTITPEVVLVENSDQTILYQGRIDDEFVRVGKRRFFTTSNDLENAIQSVLNNEPVTVKKTEAVGCFINFFDNLQD
jgi:hypothetical protein